MSELLERCAVCQAMLDEEDLFCANCGTEAPGRAQLAQDAPNQTTGSLVSTHNFECQGCGASMSYDASAQTLRCPFCGSEKLDEQKDAKTVAPNRVLPFDVKRDAAMNSLRAWLKKGFWRPGDLSDAAIVTKMTPVFVPYWVFSARVNAFWTADSSQTPAGARGDWYPLSGTHQGEYRGLLVGASGALTPAETTAICPFDLNKSVSPDQVDLENVVFEQFRVQRKYARPLARQGFENLANQDCCKYVPGRCRNLKVNAQLEGLTSEAVLLPVWIMAYRYQDRVFRFLLNGQTGKATGQAPTSWKKVLVAIGIAVLVVVIGAAVIAVSSAR
jgi:predicted RNA-binding Zn-ribbon protein involved in translation (DUF1610 family)